MLFVWLIAWLCYGTPSLHHWSGWAVALIVCAAIDLLGGGAGTRR